jgi:2-dehydro-3-deoxyphosphooctonate aldolase (KDO 8-P synthase)
MNNVVEKVLSEGNKKVLVTERGSCFGYNNLVVDYRGVILMLRAKHNVVFDATHSVQLPSAQGKTSGGDRSLAPSMAYAAAAVGVKGFFFETHPNPEKALSDGPNSVYLKDMEGIIRNLLALCASK